MYRLTKKDKRIRRRLKKKLRLNRRIDIETLRMLKELLDNLSVKPIEIDGTEYYSFYKKEACEE